MNVLKMGVVDFVLPLVFWVPVFFTVALVTGIVVTRACRRRLRERSFQTTWPTVALVLLCVVGASFGAAALAVPFSLERSAGLLFEEGGRALADHAANAGEKRARELIGVRSSDETVALADVRARLKGHVGESIGSNPGVRASGWAGILAALPGVLESGYLA